MDSSDLLKMCEETMPSPNGTLKLLFKQRPGESSEEFDQRVFLAITAQGDRQAKASRNLERLLQESDKLLSSHEARPQTSIGRSLRRIRTTARTLLSGLAKLRRLLAM